MQRKFLTRLCLVLFFFAFSLQAQTWRQFTKADGLPKDNFNTMTVDQRGNLWIGMPHAISRINGDIVTETYDMAQSGVRLIFESTDSSVWVPTRPGLFRYDQNMDRQYFDQMRWVWFYTMVELNNGDIWSAARGLYGAEYLWHFDGKDWSVIDSMEPNVTHMIEGPEGALWTIFKNHGLQTYDIETGTWSQQQIRGQKPTSIMKDMDQVLWVSTSSGLWQYQDKKWHSYKHLEGTNVFATFQTSDNDMWVATQNGLWQFDGIHWRHHLQGQEVYTLRQTQNRQVWVGSKDGLWQLKGDQWLSHDQLAGIKFIEIAETPDGGMWALARDSLWRLSPAGWFSHQDMKGTAVFSRDQVWSSQRNPILKSGSGDLWVGTHEDGIWKFDGAEWLQSTELAKTGVHLISETVNGHIWAGTLTRGLWQFDGQAWRQPNQLKEVEVRSMLVSEKDHSLWVGTFGKGLWQFDGRSWIQHAQPSREKPGDIAISYLLETINGEIMAGTWGDGLWQFDGIKWDSVSTMAEGSIVGKLWQSRTGEIILYYRDVLTPDGRPGVTSNWGICRFDGSDWSKIFHRRHIPVILQTSEGKIWASMRIYTGGHSGWGLYWSDDGIEWHKQDGPEEFLITALVQSANGDMWMGTDENGVWKFDGQKWYSFGIEEGLPSSRIAELYLDPDELLWVGTGGGVVQYRFNENRPTVKIETVDDESVSYFTDRDDYIYTTGKSSVFVHWRAFDKETPAGRLTFQYRMNEDDWFQPTTATSVTTPPMESGKHTFAVRAIDRDANLSQSDSFTFQVDLERPEVQITLPKDQTIVSGRQGQIVIRGTVVDKDLDQFRVEISSLANPSRFQLVNQVEDAEKAGGRDRPLGLWQTQRLAQTDYLIRLSAQDKLGHQKSDQIQVTLDNTLPAVEIIAPEDQERVLKQFTISAVASDLHLNSYRLDFAPTDNPDYTTAWEQIFVQANLHQPKKDKQLKQPQVAKFEKDWEVPIKEGVIWLRVAATDIAGNTASQMIQVEIPTAVLTRQGGSVRPEDRQVELYFPPNALSQDEIVTINVLTSVEVEPPVRRITSIYDFAPSTLRLNAIKPATLTLSYDPSQLSTGKEPVIFHRTDGPWKAVGGTVNAQQQTISAAVLSLGQYTLGEMDKIQGLDSANLKPDSLTCQPRVFSPKGNAFSTHTTISFILDQPAQVTIKVYNVSGQLVEWLAQQQTFGSGKQAIPWSGRDSEGEVVASGLYIVTVMVGDQRQDKVVNVWNH